jgi:hypothetical protein
MTAKSEKLELEEHEAFQRAEWRVQRVGWVVWGLVVLAAMMGLIGPGPLSSRELSSPDGTLTVAFDRFLHYSQGAELDFVARPKEETGPLSLHVSQSLLDGMQIVRIEPEPAERKLAGDGVVYVFARHAPAGDYEITFHIQYEHFGEHTGRIAVGGHEPALLSQFIFP